MLKIDFNRSFDNVIIQNNWKEGLIPHFPGIVIGDGNMVSMKQKYADTEGRGECYVYSDHESTIEKFIAHSDHFVEINAMVNRVYVPECDCYAICGEGAMGNEGFVALVKGETLIWAAFFTISNPFYEVARNGDFIVAKSTHDLLWEFPIAEPWKARALVPDLKNRPNFETYN
jgi:hypothetical protein